MPQSVEKNIKLYKRSNGVSPFKEWMTSLRNKEAKARINNRITRLRGGNPGDVKSLGDGVYELRIDYGSGYRVYLGQLGQAVILLLCGGDKTTQQADIDAAKEYWQDFKDRGGML